eukprot:2408206-Alexandrium_andersonii.AAC.1
MNRVLPAPEDAPARKRIRGKQPRPVAYLDCLLPALPDACSESSMAIEGSTDLFVRETRYAHLNCSC